MNINKSDLSYIIFLISFKILFSWYSTARITTNLPIYTSTSSNLTVFCKYAYEHAISKYVAN